MGDTLGVTIERIEIKEPADQSHKDDAFKKEHGEKVGKRFEAFTVCLYKNGRYVKEKTKKMDRKYLHKENQRWRTEEGIVTKGCSCATDLINKEFSPRVLNATGLQLCVFAPNPQKHCIFLYYWYFWGQSPVLLRSLPLYY